MSDFVLDASLALQWFLEDETNRQYGLDVLASLSEKRALVPILWFYEVGNGLVMAHRRKRISRDQFVGFISRVENLPIDCARQTAAVLAQRHGLTNYDAAYLGLAMQFSLPLATTDKRLVEAATSAGVNLVFA